MVYVRATKTALLNRIPRGRDRTPLAGYTEKDTVFDWPEECGEPDLACVRVLEPKELDRLGLSDGQPRNSRIKKKERRPAVAGPRINDAGEIEA